jgi:hypothetical protein
MYLGSSNLDAFLRNKKATQTNQEGQTLDLQCFPDEVLGLWWTWKTAFDGGVWHLRLRRVAAKWRRTLIHQYLSNIWRL